MRERENSGLMDVEATIYCERESHKGIVIGKKGAMLKKVSTYAREDMERFFNIRHSFAVLGQGEGGLAQPRGTDPQLRLGLRPMIS